MKKIIYSLWVCLACVLVSCEGDTTQDLSKITYYVNFEVQGDEFMTVPVGTPFVDPGVIATEGEKDVTSSVVTSGSVNSNKLGIYTLTYSAINVDGFPSSTTRTVAVCDPTITTDISGVYTVADGTYRLTKASGAKVAYSGYPVTIAKVAPGTFYVSDFFGGYYDKRAGYGANYAMTGYINLNADNTLGLLNSHVNGWGDSIDSFTDAKFDPASSTVSWGAGYAGSMIFYVTLN